MNKRWYERVNYPNEATQEMIKEANKMTREKEYSKIQLSDVNFGRTINTRIQTYFKNLGLDRVQEVVDYPLNDLIKIKGFGKKALTAVQMVFIENDYWVYNG